MLNPPRSFPSGRVTLDGWAFAARRTLVGGACIVLTSTTACVAQRAEAVARAAAASDVAASRVVLVGGPGTVGSAPVWATPGTRTSDAAPAPVNVTCPVWVGHPVDPRVTEVWQGVLVAFKDAYARRAWAADPAAYAGRLPRLSGSGGDSSPASRAGVAPAPAVGGTSSGGTSSAMGTPDGPRTAAAERAATHPGSTAPSRPATFAALGSPDVPVAAPTELPPAVRRRPASAARVVPPPPASIGSPDAVVRGEPVPVVRARPSARATVPSVPSAGAMGSPDGRPARPAAGAPAAPPPRVPPAVRAAPAPAVAPPVVAPPCTPDDDEECPGGVCRVPGM